MVCDAAEDHHETQVGGGKFRFSKLVQYFTFHMRNLTNAGRDVGKITDRELLKVIQKGTAKSEDASTAAAEVSSSASHPRTYADIGVDICGRSYTILSLGPAKAEGLADHSGVPRLNKRNKQICGCSSPHRSVPAGDIPPINFRRKRKWPTRDVCQEFGDWL